VVVREKSSGRMEENSRREMYGYSKGEIGARKGKAGRRRRAGIREGIIIFRIRCSTMVCQCISGQVNPGKSFESD